jgi:hypothetical protein
MSPFRRRTLEEHDDPQLLTSDARMIHLRDYKVQPVFRLLAGSAEPRKGLGMPTASHRTEVLLVAR